MNLLIIVPLEVDEDNIETMLNGTLEQMFGQPGVNRTVHVCIADVADKILDIIGHEAAAEKEPTDAP